MATCSTSGVSHTERWSKVWRLEHFCSAPFGTLAPAGSSIERSELRGHGSEACTSDGSKPFADLMAQRGAIYIGPSIYIGPYISTDLYRVDNMTTSRQHDRYSALQHLLIGPSSIYRSVVEAMARLQVCDGRGASSSSVSQPTPGQIKSNLLRTSRRHRNAKLKLKCPQRFDAHEKGRSSSPNSASRTGRGVGVRTHKEAVHALPTLPNESSRSGICSNAEASTHQTASSESSRMCINQAEDPALHLHRPSTAPRDTHQDDQRRALSFIQTEAHRVLVKVLFLPRRSECSMADLLEHTVLSLADLFSGLSRFHDDNCVFITSVPCASAAGPHVSPHADNMVYNVSETQSWARLGDS